MMPTKIHVAQSRATYRWKPWLTAGIVGIVIAGGWLLIGRSSPSAESTIVSTKPNVELTGHDPPTLRVPPDVMKSLRINTVSVKPYTLPRVLQLDGTLFADPSQIARVAEGSVQKSLADSQAKNC